MVERLVWVQEVAGSNPVTPITPYRYLLVLVCIKTYPNPYTEEQAVLGVREVTEGSLAYGYSRFGGILKWQEDALLMR